MNSQSQRIAISKLLHLSAAMAKTGFISKVNKGFLKDMIVDKDEEVLKIACKLNKDLEIEDIINILHGIIARRVQKVYDELFQDCSLERAHLLACEDQRAFAEQPSSGADSKSLVYGEVEFDAFYEVLQHAGAGMPSGMRFYDLGSGTGRAIFVAVLTLDLKFAGGIEILKQIHDASLEVLERYNQSILPGLTDPALIKFFHGSFLDDTYDWTNGDLIFANSTCFEEDLLEKIASKAENLCPGARVITFTMALRSLWFKIIYKKRFNMSWGPATVYIHQKLSQDQYLERLSTPTEYDDDQGISVLVDRKMNEVDSMFNNASGSPSRNGSAFESASAFESGSVDESDDEALLDLKDDDDEES